MRNPNCNCYICLKPIYRRPKESNNKCCSFDCYFQKKSIEAKERRTKNCESCGKRFDSKQRAKTCSRSCANKKRKGSGYKKLRLPDSSSARRLLALKNAFNFTSCMIEGCDYCRTYDVHRYVEGKNGGKYEIGNMYAICPNHHAEITRKIIVVEKINDWTLKIISSKETICQMTGLAHVL